MHDRRQMTRRFKARYLTSDVKRNTCGPDHRPANRAPVHSHLSDRGAPTCPGRLGLPDPEHFGRIFFQSANMMMPKGIPQIAVG